MTHSRASLPDEPSARTPSLDSEPIRAEIRRQALKDWLLAGFELFIGDGAALPTRQAVDDAAQRVIVAAALKQRGTISGAAEILGTSRRALRDTMKRLGLYDGWRARGGTERAGSSGRYKEEAR